jgi:thymidylate kinase
MDAGQHRAALADRLLGSLKESRIPFCVVGDTSQFPDCIPSDLDFIIEDPDAPKLQELIFCLVQECGCQLVHAVPYQRKARCFIVAGIDPTGPPWFLLLDFSCGYSERARALVGASQFLDERRLSIGLDHDSKGFAVAAHATEFIYYLLKKIEKQSLNERQARYLSSTYREDPVGAVAQLRRFWGETDVDLLARAGASGDWSDFSSMLPRLRMALHHTRPIPLAARLHEVMRVIDRMLKPTGLWIVILGPDGSGKSTILNRVADDIAPAFRRTQLFHLRAPLVPNGKAVRACDDPHGQPLRGIVASLAQLAVNLARCWLGYWLRVWPALVRLNFVGFDRYYHDRLVDPRRYRYGGPHWLARLTSAWVPTPDLWILLDAPASVIEARKSEVPPEEIERQRTAYRELVSRLRHGYIVDASRSPDEVAHAVERIIVDFLAARTARRLALGYP